MASPLPTDLDWRKSSFSSDNGACVEVADLRADLVAVRDSKRQEAGHLVVSRRSLLTVARTRV